MEMFVRRMEYYTKFCEKEKAFVRGKCLKKHNLKYCGRK